MSDQAWTAIALCSWLVGAWMAKRVNDGHWRDDAVEAGHAEYYLDENNQRQWRWKGKR